MGEGNNGKKKEWIAFYTNPVLSYTILPSLKNDRELFGQATLSAESFFPNETFQTREHVRGCQDTSISLKVQYLLTEEHLSAESFFPKETFQSREHVRGCRTVPQVTAIAAINANLNHAVVRTRSHTTSALEQVFRHTGVEILL